MPWSDPPIEASTPLDAAASRGRERAAATLLGWFHLALALPVLGGAWFAELAIDRALSAAAAAVFAVVGDAFLALGRRLARPPRRESPP